MFLCTANVHVRGALLCCSLEDQLQIHGLPEINHLNRDEVMSNEGAEDAGPGAKVFSAFL